MFAFFAGLLHCRPPAQPWPPAIVRAARAVDVRGVEALLGDALLEDASWQQLLRYAVTNKAYRGCPHALCLEGAEDEDESIALSMAELATQALGAGDMSKMYPSLSRTNEQYHYGLEQEQDDLPWRVVL